MYSRTPRGCVDWNVSSKVWYMMHSESHSSWVRGLKRGCLLDIFFDVCVALLVGAWIETKADRMEDATERRSHSSWVRGLKLLCLSSATGYTCRTPRGCVDWNSFRWIRQARFYSRTPRGCVDWNFSVANLFWRSSMSHSSWVRGLKLLYHLCVSQRVESHSSWVRGLKQPLGA